jgi:hypothetical protein
MERVGEEFDAYPFDLARLLESMDRLLLAAGAVVGLQDWTGDDWGPEHEEEEKPARKEINVVRQMVLNGVDEQAAGLTLIPGVGGQADQRRHSQSVRSCGMSA